MAWLVSCLAIISITALLIMLQALCTETMVLAGIAALAGLGGFAAVKGTNNNQKSLSGRRQRQP